MEQLLLLLSPFAPHIVEELGGRSGFAPGGGEGGLPVGPARCGEAETQIDTTVTMAVQVLGKLKGHRHRGQGQRPAGRRRRGAAAR